MSGYILCQVKRAKLPYYIENISTNIYSIEELCFYFYHNIYLLDSTILNEELCFWIRDQLGLKKLAYNLYKHLDDDDMKVGDFILPVFKEINYLSLEEFRKLNQQIQQLAKEPEVLRQKRKGDYLMEHGIDRERLILEERSTSTTENLKFSLALIGLDHSVGVVTNNFHVFRGTAIGRKCGCKEIYPIPSKYCSWRLLIYIPREILAIIKDKIMGNL